MEHFGKKDGSIANSSRMVVKARTVLETSIVFHVVARIVSSVLGSVTYRAIRNVACSLARVERGLQGSLPAVRRLEDDRLMVSIANPSVVVRTLEWLIVVPVIAWRGCRLGFLGDFLSQLGLSDRVRLAGVLLSAALVSQAIAVSVAGVSIQILGWSARCGLAVICLLFYFRPHLVATAWTARWNAGARSILKN